MKIHPKRVYGTFRTLKWWIMAATLGIYYVTPWLRWDRGPGAAHQALLKDWIANYGDDKGRLTIYDPVGCEACGDSGYKGRVGLYEVMLISEEIRDLAIERASAERIREVAVKQGMRVLRDDGLEKIRAGVTSVTEVARVTGTGATDEVEEAW